MVVTKSNARALLVLSCLALFACPPAKPTPKPLDTTTVTKAIGAAGGELEHPTGAKLIVPAGALTSEVTLSITGAEAPAAGAPAVGQAFVLGPEGQQFAKPVTMEVPVDPSLVQSLEADTDDLRLRLSPQTTLAFVELATTQDRARQMLTAQLTHFSIIVPVVASNPFTFSTSGLPAASVGVAYLGAIVVSGGTAPYSFSTVAGALPPGLALNAQGLFSGTPTQAGSFSFTVRVTDGASASAEAIVVLDVGGVGQCNTVPNSASLVNEQRVAGSAPAPTGGTIVTGTWERAATTIYTSGATGPSGRQTRHTIRITDVSGGLRFDSVNQAPGENLDVVSGSASASGTQLTVSFNCPMMATKVFGYSATASTLVLYEQVSEGLREMIFVPAGTVLPTDGGVDAGVDGGTTSCSAPAASGALVAEQFAAGVGPQAGGGVVPDGEYELITQTLFGSDAGTSGATGRQRRQTVNISGSSISTSIVDNTQGSQSLQFSLTYAGPTMTLVQTCPAGSNPQNFAYTMIASDQLQLVRGSSRGTELQVFRLTTATDGGTTTDAGVDAGTPIEVLGTGFTDLVDLSYDPAQPGLYTLGNGTVNRCDVTGCAGGTGTLVTNVYASSLAVNAGTLFVTTDFRNVKTCDVTSCTLTTFLDVGANSYPAHLVVANSRIYWMSESGSSRRIQACPLTGCASPTAVYSGAELDGVPVSGIAVDGTNVYVSSFTGGLWAIPLSNPDTASGPATSLLGSAYGTGGLLVDGSILGWAEGNDNRVMACSLPACSSSMTAVSGLRGPSALAVDSTYLYGTDRGTPNGSGGWVAGTARVWRWLK